MARNLPQVPIQKVVLRDKIVEILKEWILNGTLKPGDRIVESVLANHLRVSRVPFREALWLLAHQGFVRMEPHQGAFVTELSMEDIQEIFELRKMLEARAAKRIYARRSPQTRAKLEKAVADLEAATLTRDMREFSRVDFEFHKTIWELSGSKHLKEILEVICGRFLGYELIRDLDHPEAFDFEKSITDHRQMVTLILEGSEDDIEPGYDKIMDTFLGDFLSRLEKRNAR